MLASTSDNLWRILFNPLARREVPAEGEGANIDRCLVPYPLARREAPAEGRRPEGEGANIDRGLVPYDAKCKRIQSHIEFIYIYIYIFIFICVNGLLTRGIGKFGPGK